MRHDLRLKVTSVMRTIHQGRGETTLLTHIVTFQMLTKPTDPQVAKYRAKVYTRLVR
jgi:hypothetical protein